MLHVRNGICSNIIDGCIAFKNGSIIRIYIVKLLFESMEGSNVWEVYVDGVLESADIWIFCVWLKVLFSVL